MSNPDIKPNEPRFYCGNGVSLSIQASRHHYCSPRVDSYPSWTQYNLVEVGFIKGPNGEPFSPPEIWGKYGDNGVFSDVYGYVPVELVHSFIASNTANP